MTLWEGAGANNTSAKWMRVDKDATRLLGGIQVYRPTQLHYIYVRVPDFKIPLYWTINSAALNCVRACRRAYRRACLCAKEVVHNN